MYRIVKKLSLNPTVTMMEIEAPLVAKTALAGQFIILRVDEEGERIPLTVAGYDREAGTVKIIFQIVGATTEKLNHKNEGEYISDFAGPLGLPTHLDGLENVKKLQEDKLERLIFKKEELQKEVVIEDHSYEKEIRKLAKQIEKIDKELGLNKAA